MGIYLNPDSENFRRTLAADIYVDKTMMIAQTNRFIDTGKNYICVSRPRRFGKTITWNMLSSYYSKGCDSRELFAPFKIASDPGFEEKLNKYNLIKIDLNSEYQNMTYKDKLISRLTREIKRELNKTFSDVHLEEDDSLAQSILRIYSETGETFVILIDEYDVLVREQASEQLFNEYLSFLNGMFKSDTLRPAISLAYLTGILPVVRDKIQSKLNNFREYTILDANNLAEFIGFTDEEVRALCAKYGIDYEECRLWYDGYKQRGFELYNPESVVRCIEDVRFGSYWGQTSTYEAITDRIRQDFEGTKENVIKMISGENVPVNVTRYMNTMTSFKTRDDLFTYLIHVGYLAYDAETGTCRIPNKEVRQEWINAIETEPDYKVTYDIIQESEFLVAETVKRNEEAVAEALNNTHIHVTSNRNYNSEDALASAIYLAYIHLLNTHTCIKEMTAGKGFADMVYIPVKKEEPAFIIELKRNDSPESAIQQIAEREYSMGLTHHKENLYLVGIEYDPKTKKHSCKIEKYRKY